MKIQCDVCDKVEASVFCPADEAALCHNCDRTIHHANKLASKHSRFTLHHPTSKDSPLCDIQKHNRFLLTGLKLSNTCLDPDSSSTNGPNRVTASRSKANRPRSVSNENQSSSCKVEDNMASDTGSVSTSSISEYLIETIPGYCFEDFLDASFAPNGFCKNYDYHSEFQNQDLEVSTCLFPISPSSLPQISSSVVRVKEIPKANIVKGNSKRCTVPETSPSFIKISRRSR